MEERYWSHVATAIAEPSSVNAMHTFSPRQSNSQAEIGIHEEPWAVRVLTKQVTSSVAVYAMSRSPNVCAERLSEGACQRLDDSRHIM